MKKRILAVNTIALFSLALAGVAFAESSASVKATTSVKVRTNDGKAIEDKVIKLEEQHEKRLNQEEARKDKMQQEIKKRIDRLETKIGARFEVYLKHLQNAQTRLSTFIDKLTSEGKNTTEAKAKLAIANTKISLAVTAVADLNTYADTLKTATSTPTKDFITAFRKKRDAARKALVEAEKALRDTIAEVKKIEKVRIQATSTTAVTASSTN